MVGTTCLLVSGDDRGIVIDSFGPNMTYVPVEEIVQDIHLRALRACGVPENLIADFSPRALKRLGEAALRVLPIVDPRRN